MSQDKLEHIIVTIDDHHLQMIQTVATELESAGMKVEQVMSTVGIITGEVSQSQIQMLHNVSGVVNVESDEQMQAI